MAIIGASDAKVIREHFDKHLTGDVKVTYFGQKDSSSEIPAQECQYCEQTRGMVEELSQLSDKISLEIMDFVTDSDQVKSYGIERIPAIVLEGAARGKVRYFGVPAGYEFSELVEGLVDVSSGDPKLSAATLDALAGLKEPVHIQVFSTPT